MPKQYGSNGINSDGSLMNVGNTIWDPSTGGRPSIRIDHKKSAMAATTPPWLLDGPYEESKSNPVQVLIVCWSNSCTSQMAEGILREILPSSIANVASAGLQPSMVNSSAKAVMYEIGIDLNPYTSKSIDTFQSNEWDYVISLCGCASSLPFGWQATHQWDVHDPPNIDRGELSAYRKVRDDVITNCNQLRSCILRR